MGLLCSKCRLKSFGARKKQKASPALDQSNGAIEIRNGTEKTTHFGSKFTRRKVAKKRPVISAPRPVNPVHLNGRKWKHVIVTIPVIDEPPIPPARKKRKPCSKKVDTLASRSVDTVDAESTKKLSFFEIMSAIQLRRCLRSLDTGDAGDGGAAGQPNGNSERVSKRAASLDDLFLTFLHGNETAITVFAASLPFNIDYTKNRSLTNEPNDSFFDNANACGCGDGDGSRIKKNLVVWQTACDDLRQHRQPAKRDLDKLKFCEICQPPQPPFERRINANCIEIRAPSRDNSAENRTLRRCHCYVFVTRNINRRVVSITSTSSHRQQRSNSLNVKNISNKTNQKPYNMYSSSSTNIEKVSDEMKKTLDKNVPPSSSPASRIASDCHIRENHLTSGFPVHRPDDLDALAEADEVARLNSDQSCKRMKNCCVPDEGDVDQRDPDSDTSSTDSLTEFTYSLGT